VAHASAAARSAPEPCPLCLGGDDQLSDIGAWLTAEMNLPRDAHEADWLPRRLLGNEHRLIRADAGDRAGDPTLRDHQECRFIEPRREADQKARGERHYGSVIGGGVWAYLHRRMRLLHRFHLISHAPLLLMKRPLVRVRVPIAVARMRLSYGTMLTRGMVARTRRHNAIFGRP